MGFYLQTQPEETEQVKKASVKFVRAIPALWLFGTVLIAAYVCVRSISLWRTVKRERPITDQKILDLLEDCKMQIRVETIVAVVVSDRIKSPALFGFVRPRLLLPQGMLETCGLEELRYVFIHELAHLKQRDIYLGWLMALLHVVHWFNPLMWFAFSRIRADREIACDRLAISTMEPDEPPQYGRTIVSLLERFSQTRYLPSVAGILEDSCQVERRIKMIANYKKTTRTRWSAAMLLLAALACIVLTNAYVAKADFTFGTPTNLGPIVNSPRGDGTPSMSSDGMSLYFNSDRSGGYGGYDIWVTTRQSIGEPWGEPVNLGPPINTSNHEGGPVISADDLSLFFASTRPRGYGSFDVYVTTRATADDPWGEPVNLGPNVNSSGWDGAGDSLDGLTFFFDSERPGGSGAGDIWYASRPTKDDPWGEPVNLGPQVNSSGSDGSAHITADGLTLFFMSDRSGGYGGLDAWVTTRATMEDDWSTPVNLGPPINTAALDGTVILSIDGSTLYFMSGQPGGYGGHDLWQVSILPIVDFNSDGNIDNIDLLMLVESWGKNDPLYDIGPTPFGDGIVDIKDLEVFMSYWEKENIPEEPEAEL